MILWDRRGNWGEHRGILGRDGPAVRRGVFAFSSLRATLSHAGSYLSAEAGHGGNRGGHPAAPLTRIAERSEGGRGEGRGRGQSTATAALFPTLVFQPKGEGADRPSPKGEAM